MAINTVEQTILVPIPLDRIVSRLPVRRLSASGVARIQASMERSGFLDNFPLVVTPFGDGTYQLIEGNHRYEAALAAGFPTAPCIVKTDLSEQERYKLALQSNSAAEAVVPSTLVTYAEFIWARSEENHTQEEIKGMLGWSREKVAQYAALKSISPQAWQVIVTTFEQNGNSTDDDAVTPIVTTVTFTERLLRSILDLTPEQQRELVTELATNKDYSKGKFKTQAENYRARNEMYTFAFQHLGDLGEAFSTRLREEVYSGAYDADWKSADHLKLTKLITALRDEWERKNSVHLVHGDFYEEVLKIGAGSVDLILTDPPYNIARENEFELAGRSNISQDFGEWDKCDPEYFIEMFNVWAREWARILRSQGSGYVFTSDRYISHLRAALESAGLHVKATIVWHKMNPGTQVVKTNFKSSVEYLLFFTKGEGGHTFNWQGENEMHNFIESPICSGHERLVDAKGKTLHPTQKPEQVLRHFLEISSNRGDVVFDGFAGVGSVGSVAKEKGRKFIGIEQDKAYFEAMRRRIADE
jgi:site-specific DNA-methyltransferase (adenine-specific)/modification methylase